MTQAAEGRQWYIVHRWQEYDAEIRACYVRICAVVAFYAVQLYDFRINQATTVATHRLLTAIAIAWVAGSVAALICVRRRYLPAWLKYATTTVDLLLLTGLLVSRSGPQSPMVVGYFVALVLAALRFSLPLIRYATVGSLVSYLVVLACCHPDWYATAQRSITVSRREQMIVVIAITFAGIALGQMARRVRVLADEYARRIGQQP